MANHDKKLSAVSNRDVTSSRVAAEISNYATRKDQKSSWAKLAAEKLGRECQFIGVTKSEITNEH